MAAKLRKGDRVIVLTGKDRGKTGEIESVDPKSGRAVVSGVNIVKRHQRPGPGNPGGIVEREAPVHLSNVALADPDTGRPTRVGFRILDDGRKVRFAKRSGEVIDR